MADRYLLESSAVDGYLMEDSGGVLLLEEAGAPPADEIRIFWPAQLDGIGTGGPFPGHRLE